MKTSTTNQSLVNQTVRPMRNNLEVLSRRTGRAFKAYQVKVLNLKPNTAGSNNSRIKAVAEKMAISEEELHCLPLDGLKELSSKFLALDITKKSDSDLRSALRKYLKYATGQAVAFTMVLPTPQRSEIGYDRFLRKDYVRKTGEGEMLSRAQYLSYINALEKALGMYKGQIHTLSKWDVTRKVKELEDKRLTVINSRHYLSAASSYEDYVAYTLGKYQPRMAA